MQYITLDDETARETAQDDPVGRVKRLDRAVIDEVQRAPGLLLAVKHAVDENRRPGRFLLTGLANLMTLPQVADSLADRMETQLLLPLSQAEIDSSPINWVQSVFEGRIPGVEHLAVGRRIGATGA